MALLAGPLVSSRAQAPQGPFGFWAEVVSVSDKWLVVQNERGQQFPIALNSASVDLFLIRWPTTPDRLDRDCLIEVTGLSGNNNVIASDHADVFRGASALLVAETVQPLVEARPLLNPMNILMMNIFGPVYLLPPGEINLPRRLHVVGFCVGNNPIRIAQGGNVFFTVVPGTLTEVTPGLPRLIRPGDLAFCLVLNWNNQTLQLGQLVIYKPMPIDQFVP
jgi:hypothetical protein